MSTAGLRAVRHEENLDRKFPRSGHHITASDSLVPGGEIETELSRTHSDRETGVIRALDLRPVVATRKPLIGWLPEPSDVECHRGLGDVEPCGDLSLREPLLVQQPDGFACDSRRPLWARVSPPHTNRCSHPNRTERCGPNRLSPARDRFEPKSLGRQELNPRFEGQNLACCRYTTPQGWGSNSPTQQSGRTEPVKPSRKRQR